MARKEMLVRRPPRGLDTESKKRDSNSQGVGLHQLLDTIASSEEVVSPAVRLVNDLVRRVEARWRSGIDLN